jgi:hypothetical protein
MTHFAHKRRKVDYMFQKIRINDPLVILATLLGCVLAILTLLGYTLYHRGEFPYNEYIHEMHEARVVAGWGDVSRFERHLGKAQLTAEAEGLDLNAFQQESKKIRIKGYTEAAKDYFEDALSVANQGKSGLTEYCLETYSQYCRRAGLEPNQELIQRVQKMLKEASGRNIREQANGG